MNPEREQYQMPMDETMDDLALGGTKSNVAECQPSQRQSRDSDPHESMVEKVERSKIVSSPFYHISLSCLVIIFTGLIFIK